MIGVGIDAVDVERFRQSLARTPGLAERLFTAEERAYAARRTDPTERLAARFAAKEAVMKALGVGIGAFAFHDVEVVVNDDGAPSLVLGGAARALADGRGVRAWHVSLTHTAHLAEAVAIAE
jgi:holo-[acyl-carrier protein] synthase